MRAPAEPGDPPQLPLGPPRDGAMAFKFPYLGCGKLVAAWRRLETRRPETSALDPGREDGPPGID